MGEKMGIDGMAMDARKKLGARIRFLRKKREWTQQKLADIADLTMRHIQRLESKRPSAIELDTIVKISKAFRITPANLLKF